MNMKAKFRAFKRTWWKENPDYPNGLEPCAGKKTVLGRFMTEQGARDFCQGWNKTHDPGRLSLKAEYESIGKV